MAESYRQPTSRLTPDGSAGTARERADLAPLLAEPERFGLFAALRLVERAHPDRPRLGEARRARDEPMRLGQPPHLHFPPGPVAGFAPGRAGRPPRLLTYAFGLFGPQGPLPLHVSREAFARARHRSDPTLADFCDILHHRLLSLYWRAYAKARPAIEQDRPEASRFRHRLGAVAGLAGPGFLDRSALPDRFALFAAGLLALQTRPAEALGRLVSLYFAVPARVREFVGAWLDIPVPGRTRLGALPRLGRDTVVGTRVYLRHHRFRLVLGPLGFRDLLRFLPDGDAWEALSALVRRVPGPEFDWDLQLVLHHDEVPVTALGGGARLGWTSWLASRRRDRDADDVVLQGIG
jgi:type VI secretion system protein ImpH